MLGKVVLITGASSGIGACTSVHFASRGSRLSLTGRNQTNLEATVQKCLAAGAQEVLAILADLTIDSDVLDVVQKTVQKFGRLDILINNAGITKPGSLATTSLADFDQVININLRAVFYLTQQCLPYLLASKGNVVNVSSVSAVKPYNQNMPYGMSKAALDHFIRMTALELSKKNVRVNGVNAGFVNTGILDAAGSTQDADELGKRLNAMGRSGTVDEIARAIVCLADEELSSFVTGASFFVDGGANLVGPT